MTLGTDTWPLVDQIERQHGSVTVVRRCLDLSELLACAHTGMARVALIADGAEELTASLLEQLTLSSVRVLVLAGHDENRLAALGVTIVPAGATGDDVTELIEEVWILPIPWPPTAAIPIRTITPVPRRIPTGLGKHPTNQPRVTGSHNPRSRKRRRNVNPVGSSPCGDPWERRAGPLPP